MMLILLILILLIGLLIGIFFLLRNRINHHQNIQNDPNTGVFTLTAADGIVFWRKGLSPCVSTETPVLTPFLNPAVPKTMPNFWIFIKIIPAI